MNATSASPLSTDSGLLPILRPFSRSQDLVTMWPVSMRKQAIFLPLKSSGFLYLSLFSMSVMHSEPSVTVPPKMTRSSPLPT